MAYSNSSSVQSEIVFGWDAASNPSNITHELDVYKNDIVAWNFKIDSISYDGKTMMPFNSSDSI